MKVDVDSMPMINDEASILAIAAATDGCWQNLHPLMCAFVAGRWVSMDVSCTQHWLAKVTCHVLEQGLVVD